MTNPETSSRFMEMLNATIAREKLNTLTPLSPTITQSMKTAIAAMFLAKFGIYCQYLPPDIREDLYEDLAAFLRVTFPIEILDSPDFKRMTDAAVQDILAILKARIAK